MGTHVVRGKQHVKKEIFLVRRLSDRHQSQKTCDSIMDIIDSLSP